MTARASLHVLTLPEPATARQILRPVAPAGSRLWLAGTEVTFGGVDGYVADATRVVVLGSWDDATAADEFVAGGAEAVWPTGPTQAWHAVLRPLRSHGTVNWTDGAPFVAVQPGAVAGEPIVTMTTTAFSDDADKVAALVDALAEVQSGIADAPGVLASTVTLGRRRDDGRTFTVWQDESAMTEWAYRTDRHAPMIARQRTEQLMPRSSFTRFAIERSAGTWHGRDPLALWHDRRR